MVYEEELKALAVGTGVWTVSHILLHKAIIKPIGHVLITSLPKGLKDARKERDSKRKQSGNGKLSYTEEIHVLHQKFNTAAWKMLSYVFLVGVGIWALKSGAKHGWLRNPEKWVSKEKSYKLIITEIFEIILYYWLGTSYYVYSSVAMFFEPKMKDRNQMIIHHLATLTLQISSYIFGKLRYGALIMLLHDMADPWMEVSKIGLYMDNNVIPNVAFPIFTAVFIYTRNWLFPRHIIYNVWIYEQQYKFFWPTIICLSTLAVLHVFWSFLILQILINSLRGVAKGDIREEE